MAIDDVCVCATMPPGGECVPCEKWRCVCCRKVWGWWDSGTDSDEGHCDECWCRRERLRERVAAGKAKVLGK